MFSQVAIVPINTIVTAVLIRGTHTLPSVNCLRIWSQCW